MASHRLTRLAIGGILSSVRKQHESSTAMSDPRQHVEAQLEAQRHTASQASRERSKLIEESVIIAVQVKINEGRIAEARQMWLDYKRSK
jgi:hypothetical protein